MGEVNADDVAGRIVHAQPIVQMLELLLMLRIGLGSLGDGCAEDCVVQI